MFRHKYYDSTGKRKEKKKSGFKSEKAALKSLLEVKAATMSGQYKQVKHEQMTVGQWLDVWYKANEMKWKISTRIQREHVLRLHIKPVLGHYKLQRLDRLSHLLTRIFKRFRRQIHPKYDAFMA